MPNVLQDLLSTRREKILDRARSRIASRSVPRATRLELAVGVPAFFDQLVEILAAHPAQHALAETACRHGQQRMEAGFTIAQVVHDYGDVCQAITQVATEDGVAISAEDFGMLNLVLDDAISFAVTEHARRRERASAAKETERLGILAHELRNLVHTATLAYGSLREGTVPIGGSTGTLLGRTLEKLTGEIDKSLAIVRLDAGLVHLDEFRLLEFVEEVEVAASLAARARGTTLATEPVDPGVSVVADRQLLGSAVSNLLQNAVKFTPPAGQIGLRTYATPESVSIEVTDACGGLPAGQIDQLFGTYAQRDDDRSGLGLGLTICRRAAESMGGELRARDLPGTGCVFTIDVPRARG